MRKPVRLLMVSAAIMAVGHVCIHTLRFTSGGLNIIFVCAYLAVPVLAIRPVRHLPRPYKTLGLILLIPFLLYSTLDQLVGSTELIEPSQTFQQGGYTVELGRYDNGGAVGVHGFYLKQRRPVVPGLFLIRLIDAHSEAREATLSGEAPFTVRVHAQGNYYDNGAVVDKSYVLKPSVYF